MTETREAEVGRLFDIDTAEHEMTALLDQGLYRHLRFQRPKGRSSSYWYDLITLPGTLIFRGDYESLVFSRELDMFGFFRSNPDRPKRRISAHYWAQKLSSDRDCVRSYSQEKFEQLVKEATADAIRYGRAPRGIGKAVREQILGDEDICYEDGARHALEAFEHGAKAKLECHRCHRTLEIDADALEPVEWRDAHWGHNVQTRTHIEGFKFTDTWEWDFKDFEHGYLWACHAIVAGIACYDAAKAELAVYLLPVLDTAGSDGGHETA